MMILFSREEIVYETSLDSYCPVVRVVSNIFFQHFLPTHSHISPYLYIYMCAFRLLNCH